MKMKNIDDANEVIIKGTHTNTAGNQLICRQSGLILYLMECCTNL